MMIPINGMNGMSGMNGMNAMPVTPQQLQQLMMSGAISMPPNGGQNPNGMNPTTGMPFGMTQGGMDMSNSLPAMIQGPNGPQIVYMPILPTANQQQTASSQQGQNASNGQNPSSGSQQPTQGGFMGGNFPMGQMQMMMSGQNPMASGMQGFSPNGNFPMQMMQMNPNNPMSMNGMGGMPGMQMGQMSYMMPNGVNPQQQINEANKSNNSTQIEAQKNAQNKSSENLPTNLNKSNGVVLQKINSEQISVKKP
jgi:hypothetical protein